MGTIASQLCNTPNKRPGPKKKEKAASNSSKKYILEQKTSAITNEYKLGKQIGQPGAFGVARVAIHKKTGINYAVKCVSKNRFKAEDIFKGLRDEIQVMKKMKRHANVIDFIKAYEDEDTLYIVLELCTGGELFDRILSKGKFSEKDAARVLREMVEALAHLHAHDIAHCDIKPDNFLFLTKDDNSPVKLIDFGMAKREGFREYHSDTCGTPYYVAPEVLKGRYNKGCDMWSIGVVMFIMLYGFPPFAADPQKVSVPQEEQIYRQIEKGFNPVVKTGFGPWFPSSYKLSQSARDLMGRLLNNDLASRPTAEEILSHVWLKGDCPDEPLDLNVLKSLKDFDATSKFKQAVLFSMSDNLDDITLNALQDTFRKMDLDGDGYITLDELEKAFSEGNASERKSAEEIKLMMEQIDLDKDNKICYEELLVASVHRQLTAKHERLRKAFNEIDLDGNGTISPEELKSVLEHANIHLVTGDAEALISEVDKNGDGVVDFEEFMAAFAGKNKSLMMERYQSKVK